MSVCIYSARALARSRAGVCVCLCVGVCVCIIIHMSFILMKTVHCIVYVIIVTIA